MDTVAEKKLDDIGASPGIDRSDHDLVHELHDRLGRLWRYGECIAEAEGEPEAQKVWRDLLRQESASIKRLKELIVNRVEKGEFFEDL